MEKKEHVYIIPNSTPGESNIYRSPLVKEGEFVSEVEGIKTLADLLERNVKKFGDKPFVGTRSSFPDGPFVWKTYKEHLDRVLQCARGLVHIGMKPADKIGVYSANCEEWLVVEHALYMSTGIVVSLYDTLGPNAAEYVLSHADVTMVFCSVAAYPKLIAAAEQLKGQIKFVFPFGAVQDTSKAESLGIKVVLFADLLKMGAENKPELQRPVPDDLCTIMYTSGTTGEPKGVMISHKNMIAQIGGYCLQHNKFEVTDYQPIYTSYLPMAHIMERYSLMLMAFYGGSIGVYGGDIKRLGNDWQDIKPTNIVGAPRVYQRIYDKVMLAIKESGAIKQWLFWTAYNAKKKALAEGKQTPFWDKLVFMPLNKKLFGGNVRTCASGSAPLSAEVAEFFRVCFSPDMEEGWGMTETTAAVVFSDKLVGCIGYPSTTIEFKLVDVPDRNYFVTDKPCPRGEICVRGTSVTKGYYKSPEKTAEAFDKDGWLHTGDIAQINPDSSLKLIDRKKNIFKLALGEYVAPEYLETVYTRSEYVAQVFVYGDGFKSCLVAVVVPDEEVVMKWARDNKVGETFENLVKNPQLKKAILADLVALGKHSKLNSYEVVKDIYLDSTVWSLDNGILTPTMKLKRPDCLAKYQTQIDSMYKSMEPSS